MLFQKADAPPLRAEHGTAAELRWLTDPGPAYRPWTVTPTVAGSFSGTPENEAPLRTFVAAPGPMASTTAAGVIGPPACWFCQLPPAHCTTRRLNTFPVHRSRIWIGALPRSCTSVNSFDSHAPQR